VALLRDPKQHAAMSAAAAAKAREYDGERVVPMYEALYREVCG
jgi:hypothetical protein